MSLLLMLTEVSNYMEIQHTVYTERVSMDLLCIVTRIFIINDSRYCFPGRAADLPCERR